MEIKNCSENLEKIARVDYAHVYTNVHFILIFIHLFSCVCFLWCCRKLSSSCVYSSWFFYIIRSFCPFLWWNSLELLIFTQLRKALQNILVFKKFQTKYKNDCSKINSGIYEQTYKLTRHFLCIHQHFNENLFYFPDIIPRNRKLLYTFRPK